MWESSQASTAAFVHHVGGQTFRAVGVDYAAVLRANLERFRAKWGPEVRTLVTDAARRAAAP